jgi:hypothetical protein
MLLPETMRKSNGLISGKSGMRKFLKGKRGPKRHS